ncbi:MAG TPA: hypothetical protein VNJ04_20115 [Gemmatimonadaceae bacterium]|nr:hypothetical protein [Gemmatimonadaceae bacterium]
MKRLLLSIVVAVSVCSAPSAAQQQPAAGAATAGGPTLTEVQRLQVQTLAQSIEIAQLRAQQAQRDFAQAREQLTTLVQSLQVPGFDLDLQTMTYTKKPTPAEKK